MVKKKETEVQPNAGGYRKCPDCGLSFRYEEMFTQHRNLGCKPAKSADGPTWSDKEETNESSQE